MGLVVEDLKVSAKYRFYGRCFVALAFKTGRGTIKIKRLNIWALQNSGTATFKW